MRHSLFVGLLPLTLLACGGATSDGDGGNNAPSVLGGAGGEGGEGTKENPGVGGGSSNGGASVGGQPAGTGGQPTPSTGGVAWGGTGGSGVGGTGMGGVAAGGAPSTGGVWGQGGQVCCLAAAVCDPGDLDITGTDACPAGAECYENSICCSTVWCAHFAAAQDAGAAEACNPEAEYNRDYVGDSPETCMLIDFACTAPTVYFGNDCGCGCEQPADCPEWVNCMPGPEPNPACSEEALAQCPYTQVAY